MRLFILNHDVVMTFLRGVLVGFCVLILCGCGSIISRTVPGQEHSNQYYPGGQWDIRDTPWRFIAIIDLPLSLVMDTLLLPVDIRHGPYENCQTNGKAMLTRPISAILKRNIANQ